jgi:hypothetical protein
MHEYFIMNYNIIHHFNQMIGYLFLLNNEKNRLMKLNHPMDRLN